MPRNGRYHIAETFYSLQGEGHRKGSANVFVRFAGCNLQCNVAEHGFDCDTDFTARLTYDDADTLREHVSMLWGSRGYLRRAVILTGGEPSIQYDARLSLCLRVAGFYIAMESNGLVEALPEARVDYLVVSPKRGTLSEVKRTSCDELRVVVGTEADLDHAEECSVSISAEHRFLSPAFVVGGAYDGAVGKDALKLCINHCLANPTWRLSVQDHKRWGVR